MRLFPVCLFPPANIHEHYADELTRAGVDVAPPRRVKRLAHFHTLRTVSLQESFAPSQVLQAARETVHETASTCFTEERKKENR